MCDSFDCMHSAFTHNSKVDPDEPTWSSISKDSLPDSAFARKPKNGNKSSRGFPHHWVKGGKNKNDDGEYTDGELLLHRGGLKAAWSAAHGGRSGDKAEPSVIAHLRRHWDALGVKVAEIADMAGLTTAQLQQQDLELVRAAELPITFLPPSIKDVVQKYLEDLG